jgi:hypothetical protein
VRVCDDASPAVYSQALDWPGALMGPGRDYVKGRDLALADH